jgi:transposase
MAKQVKQPDPIKYSVGNDISKDEMSVCFSQINAQQHVSIKGTRKFENNLRGWKSLQSWIARFRKISDIPLSVVVEATGVYYEGFAYYFKDQGFNVSVILPNKSKNFARSLNIKTKNDLVDACLLAQMGLERILSIWKGMNAIMLKIKQLCRERIALQQMHTMVSNQLHAHSYSHKPQREIVKRMHKHLEFISNQIKVIEAELQQTCALDIPLQERVSNICTIKGIGLITALVVIAETNGFDLIENKAQLVSYAGYDVVENQSGTSLKGKTRISKKGNSHIRRALYFPALSAAAHEPKLQDIYQRIHQRNPKVKMIGAVAVQRKLLVLIYTLYKKNEPYDPKFEEKKLQEHQKSRQDSRLAYTA